MTASFATTKQKQKQQDSALWVLMVPDWSGLVPCNATDADHSTSQTDLQEWSAAPPQQTRGSLPSGSAEAPKPATLKDLLQAYQQAGMTSDAADLLMDLWQPKMNKAYDTYIKRWQQYVNKTKVLSPSHTDVANFLAELYLNQGPATVQ